MAVRYALELPIPFDILDAAVMECLPGYVRYGWIDFTREHITPVSVVYMLQHDDLGELGEIKLRKVSEKDSEMVVVDPPRPRDRSATPEEQDAIAATPDAHKRRQAWAALTRKIRGESDKLRQQRRQHQERVIGAMFSRLEHDLAWEKARQKGAILPSPEDMAMPRGPTVKTQIRGEVFKRLKDEFPEWSQDKVAMEACEELGEYVTADTVRYVYRVMGWKWERADRIR